MDDDLIGTFKRNYVTLGDCADLCKGLPDASIDVIVTSPPYWGQRTSIGSGVEEDPRCYIKNLAGIFSTLLPKLKPTGILWINIGDAYNTPINWSEKDHTYSTLGSDGQGLAATNSAYTKNRFKRKSFIDQSVPWLKYGNLLALPQRLTVSLCDSGFYFRGEVIWNKKNPLPEGRCRRPHRKHEGFYLFAKEEQHSFQISPPVDSVWIVSNEKIDGEQHYSRFPIQLPLNCISAYGKTGKDVIVLDPFSGSGTTGIAALRLNCTYIGFEIDQVQVDASNLRLNSLLTAYRA